MGLQHLKLGLSARGDIMEEFTVEVVSVGNELLTGRVVNTNASWLADRITRLGGLVKRVTAVGDDVEECSAALKEALSRKPKLLILTGGLGPTFDDRTLESLSKAVGLELEVNHEALRMVEEKYSGDLTPPRFKMARLPRGGKPLHNPVGTAPGCAVEADATTVIALPGVPSEMKAMFDLHVEPLIAGRARGAYTYRIIKVTGIEESSIAPIVDEVMKMGRGVYVKSHPKRDAGFYINVEVSSRAPTIEEAKRNVDEACRLLRELVAKAGAKAEDA
ncbi:MAG: molybdopterin-binding protein [Candidatus Nezhaarchaeota archaeon]|nr:molybdopterin-binding protein [Candidatus Nezhaarchaeota archaeon]